MHVELVWNIILGRATMKKTLYARRLFCLVMEFIIFFAGIFKLGIPTLNRVILRRLLFLCLDLFSVAPTSAVACLRFDIVVLSSL
jgi:hypothetical protein